MDLIVIPYQSVGPIRLGMTRDEVRSVITGKVETFMKGIDFKLPTDDFVDQSIHVYYKEPFICNAVELLSPANPTFQGRALIGMPFRELRKWLESIDDELDYDAGITSLQLGIGFYIPGIRKEAPNKPVESVFVFERGYFDEYYRNHGFLRKPRFEN